jgi:cell division transport system permease protein
MQLVGATRAFIRRPFVLQSILHGFIASLISLTLLMGLVYLIEKEFFFMFSLENTILLVFLGIFIIFVGIVINIISTFFSVNKYLRISDDKLYY